MAAKAKRTKGPTVAKAPTRASDRGSAPGFARATRTEALAKIFELAIESGEGIRHGVLGIPRYGKTHHLKEVNAEAVDRGVCDWVLVHDVKRPEPQYDGTLRENVADLLARPIANDESPVIVIHPSPTTIDRPDVESIAKIGLQLGRGGHPALVTVDELYHALTTAQHWAGPSYALILREGSSQRVSSAWSTQIPQQLPTEALDLCETVAVFHLAGRSAEYASARFALPRAVADHLCRLERGEFFLVTLDGCDGRIYGPA